MAIREVKSESKTERKTKERKANIYVVAINGAVFDPVWLENCDGFKNKAEAKCPSK